VRKILQNLRTLQGYIFRIIQHFATKLCNFTHFSIYALSSCSDLFAYPCLELVYNRNCLLRYTTLCDPRTGMFFRRTCDLWPVTRDLCFRPADGIPAVFYERSYDEIASELFFCPKTVSRIFNCFYSRTTLVPEGSLRGERNERLRRKSLWSHRLQIPPPHLIRFSIWILAICKNMSNPYITVS
jgi:hypothetical protein